MSTLFPLFLWFSFKSLRIIFQSQFHLFFSNFDKFLIILTPIAFTTTTTESFESKTFTIKFKTFWVLTIASLLLFPSCFSLLPILWFLLFLGYFDKRLFWSRLLRNLVIKNINFVQIKSLLEIILRLNLNKFILNLEFVLIFSLFPIGIIKDLILCCNIMTISTCLIFIHVIRFEFCSCSCCFF